MTVTVAEPKAMKVELLCHGGMAAVEELRSYAIAVGGRFVLFGSAVAGRLKYDSDFDLVVDFPPP